MRLPVLAIFCVCSCSQEPRSQTEFLPAPPEVQLSFAERLERARPSLDSLASAVGFHLGDFHDLGTEVFDGNVLQVEVTDMFSTVDPQGRFMATAVVRMHSHLGSPQGPEIPEFLFLEFSRPANDTTWYLLTNNGFPYSIVAEDQTERPLQYLTGAIAIFQPTMDVWEWYRPL